MNNPIKIPPMGESISEVVIARLIQPDGAFVAKNDEIIEIETDKVNQPLYAPVAGKLSWNVKEGETHPIGMVIGEIDPSQQGASAPPPQPKSEKISPPPAQPPVAQEKLRFQEEEFLRPPVDRSPPPVSTPSDEQRKPLSPIRKTIARRLVAALHESAMLTTFNEADMSTILKLRKEHQDRFTKRFGVKLGLMSFFVQAVVSALKAFPDFNSYLDGETIVYRQGIDIGIAVGTERGLVVPVIRQADTMALHEIEQEIIRYAEKAKSGRISIQDLEGGGFTITNGGVYGSLLSTPILNPPQVGILGMHKIMERPIALSGEVVIRPMMYLALSYDHRLIDGKGAVGFLVHIKEVLEDPATSLF